MPQRSDVIVSVKSSRVLDEQSAAVVIQDAWRSYNVSLIYTTTNKGQRKRDESWRKKKSFWLLCSAG